MRLQQSRRAGCVTEITCDAKNCHYNASGKCEAGSVDIADSTGVGQTMCASFAMK